MKLNYFLVILFAILPVESVSNIKFEEKQNGNTFPPLVFDILKYDDDTVVVHVVRAINTDKNYVYLEQQLSFRTIYPNGTINAIDISMEKLDIQSINFRLITFINTQYNPITLYAVKSNILLVTHVMTENSDDLSTYQKRAMLVDLSGNIQASSKIQLGPSFFNNYPLSFYLKSNIDKDKGFLYVGLTPTNNNTVISAELLQYKVADNGTVIIPLTTKSTQHSINLTSQNMMSVTPTIDGGYAFIFANSTGSTNSSDPLSLSPLGGIYGVILGYGESSVRGPSVLYQTTSSLNFTTLDCEVAYSGVGQTCIATITPNLVNSTNSNQKNYYIKVDFLSKGSVFQVNVITVDKPISSYSNVAYYVNQLPFGGQLLRSFYKDNNGQKVNGTIIDDNGKPTPWEFSNPVLVGIRPNVVILSNNTLVMTQPSSGNNWGLLFTDLPKLAGESKYDNIVISNTVPNIHDAIQKDMKQFQVTYNQQVVLSNGSITIFQVKDSSPDPSTDIMRQKINPSVASNAFCNGDPDLHCVQLVNDTTVNIVIISSTFNKPGGTYYALIDNNFVKNVVYDEPLYGLDKPIWSFTVSNTSNDNKVDKAVQWAHLDKIDGTVQLNPNGTRFFKSLNSTKDFIDKLKNELADAIPINRERLTSNYKFQNNIQSRRSPTPIILSINIDKAKNGTERTSESISEDLNALILNLPITVLASGEASKWLDATYGYKASPSWLERNAIKLTVTAVYILLLISLFAICWFLDNKNGNNISEEDNKTEEEKDELIKKGLSNYFNLEKETVDNITKNDFIMKLIKKSKFFVIFTIGETVARPVIDVLFATLEAGEVEGIYITSIFFIIIPFVVNLGIMFRLALEEVGGAKVEVDPEKEGNNEGSSNSNDEGKSNNQEGSNPKKVKSLRDLYLEHPTIFVIIILLSGFNSNTFGVVQKNFTILGVSYNVEFNNEKLSNRLLSWTDHIKAFLKNLPEIVVQCIFFVRTIEFSFMSLLKFILSLNPIYVWKYVLLRRGNP